jgi:hypothetical protein
MLISAMLWDECVLRINRFPNLKNLWNKAHVLVVLVLNVDRLSVRKVAKSHQSLTCHFSISRNLYNLMCHLKKISILAPKCQTCLSHMLVFRESYGTPVSSIKSLGQVARSRGLVPSKIFLFFNLWMFLQLWKIDTFMKLCNFNSPQPYRKGI